MFPKEGTTVPAVEGYDAGAAITIDPNSGSTFPGHPFWGIAHRHDLRFVIDDHVLDSVRIDALLLDTGTAGVVGPPSEVAKIIDATQGRLKRTSSDPKQVVADAACDLPIKLGFEIGGRRTTFTAIRKPSPAAPQYIRMAVDGQGSENVQAVQAIKSYQTAGVNVHLEQDAQLCRRPDGIDRIPIRKPLAQDAETKTRSCKTHTWRIAQIVANDAPSRSPAILRSTKCSHKTARL